MSRVLKIDVDLPYELFIMLYKEWLETREAILSRYGLRVTEYHITRSPSGKTHVYLYVDRPLNARETAVLQFLCGDDHRRALFNFARLAYGEKIFHAFNILFSEKKHVEAGKDPIVELALRGLKHD